MVCWIGDLDLARRHWSNIYHVHGLCAVWNSSGVTGLQYQWTSLWTCSQCVPETSELLKYRGWIGLIWCLLCDFAQEPKWLGRGRRKLQACDFSFHCKGLPSKSISVTQVYNKSIQDWSKAKIDEDWSCWWSCSSGAFEDLKATSLGPVLLQLPAIGRTLQESRNGWPVNATWDRRCIADDSFLKMFIDDEDYWRLMMLEIMHCMMPRWCYMLKMPKRCRKVDKRFLFSDTDRGDLISLLKKWRATLV